MCQEVKEIVSLPSRHSEEVAAQGCVNGLMVMIMRQIYTFLSAVFSIHEVQEIYEKEHNEFPAFSSLQLTYMFHNFLGN